MITQLRSRKKSAQSQPSKASSLKWGQIYLGSVRVCRWLSHRMSNPHLWADIFACALQQSPSAEVIWQILGGDAVEAVHPLLQA